VVSPIEDLAMPRTPFVVAVLLGALATTTAAAGPRARDLGIPFEGTPGTHNAITDVPGVLVGHTTLIRGRGPSAVRTGVTAILPRKELGYYPAASFVLNGDGEFSGLVFAEEFGMLRSPIMLTGTGSNGTVFNGVLKWSLRKFPERPVYIPAVGDTWDADVSDFAAFPLSEADVAAALDGARGGPVAEGSVGGGTGMICHYFKCGIGTASRVIDREQGGYTVGVLVQANYGRREDLRIAGVPVGREITDLQPVFPAPAAGDAEDDGSILIVVATDAPVGQSVLKAIAKRATMGLARNGSTANPMSGDFVLAFATTAVAWPDKPPYVQSKEQLFFYAGEHLYAATVQATEEAIVNALVAARDMDGKDGSRVHALPHDRLRDIMRRYNRLDEAE
jgi:D-aminopeptidase